MADAPERRVTSSPPLTGDAATEAQLRQLLQKEPGNAEAWCQLGLLALRQGQQQAALEHLEKAVQLAPDQAPLHHHLAACYQALGQRDRAEEHFHQVVCLKPEYAAAHNNWGIALAYRGRHADAGAAFAQAIRLQPIYPEAHNNWGNILFEQGQYDQAVEHFRQALTQHPHYPEAHNNLGLALARLGKHDEARAAFQEAIRLHPAYDGAQQNLANLHRDQGRFDEAVSSYRRLLDLRPDHREARLQLAIALARQGLIEDAIATLHQSLLFHPEVPDTYNQLGVLLAQRDRLAEATAAFRQVLRLQPNNAEALNNLGNTLLRQQKTDEALRCFQQALEQRRDYPQPYCNLATALLQQGKAEEAVSYYLEALRLQPDYVDAHFNLGNAYRSLNQQDRAVACFEEVLRHQPDNEGARLNRGVALSEQGRLDEAAALLEELLRDRPDNAPACNSLGVVRLHQDRHADALAAFEHGLRLKPDDADTHVNRALAWLATGDYERGWTEYEWRWKLRKVMPASYPQPTWDGTPLPGGTIVLWAEQGLGDTLQFVRYASLVKERVGTVLLDCPGPLRGLMVSCPGIDGLVGAGAALPPPDVQAPLLSLPRILGTTLETIPATAPYLFVDTATRERWRDRVGPRHGLKVGLVWQGNPKFAGDRQRSVRLSQLRPLSEVEGVRLFGIQKGPGSEQLEEHAGPWNITDLGRDISGDFRDTAAALMSLDLLVSVDTAVAHLAGALGVPVWILLPFTADWRWLRQRADSIWYPSARLFRQGRWGDWDGVIDRVAEALRDRARRPLLQRVTVPLGPVELLERALLQEIRDAHAQEGWAAVREAGIAETTEIAEQTERLKAAHQTLEQLGEQVQLLDLTAPVDTRTGELLRLFAQAQQDRKRCLKQLSIWLESDR